MVLQPTDRRWNVAAAIALFLPVLWLTVSRAGSPAAEAAGPTSSSEVPRYRFAVGQELAYEQTSAEDLLPKSPEGESDRNRRERQIGWRVWVLGQNEDDSWRLLIRKRVKLVDTTPGGDSKVAFENEFLGRCDLTPRGTFAVNETLGDNPLFAINPEELFVQFPTNHPQLQHGWRYASALDGATYAFAAAELSDDRMLRLTGTIESPLDVNYQLTETRSADFDVQRGVITLIQNDRQQHWDRFPSHRRETIRLTSLRERERDWTRNLDSEANGYFSALKEWGDLWSRAIRERTAAACDEKLTKARSRLEAFRSTATISDLRELADASLRLHDRDADYERDQAAKREAWYARPPIDWETTDFNGESHRLADYRGKVVVLDFWYRSCGHCILAFPKFKELVAKYAGQNVVFLGMNQDADDEDGRYVIDHYVLTYPNLRALDVAKQYEINTGPTFIVLDQSGQVVEYHPGRSDDLVEHISGVVDDLLASPPSVK
jgi:thiol-disulfide isomerase/thioredoxin